MNILDIIFIIIFLVLAYIGIRKGFIAYMIQFIGLSASLLLFIKATPIVRKWLQQQLSLANLIATILTYFLIFGAIYIIARIITNLANKIEKTSHHTWANRLSGGLLGLASGFFFIMIFVLFPDIFPWNQKKPDPNQLPYVTESSFHRDELDALFAYLQNNSKSAEKKSYSNPKHFSKQKNNNINEASTIYRRESKQQTMQRKFKRITSHSKILSMARDYITKLKLRLSQLRLKK